MIVDRHSFPIAVLAMVFGLASTVAAVWWKMQRVAEREKVARKKKLPEWRSW